jgi:hypothetical protein
MLKILALTVATVLFLAPARPDEKAPGPPSPEPAPEQPAAKKEPSFLHDAGWFIAAVVALLWFAKRREDQT